MTHAGRGHDGLRARLERHQPTRRRWRAWSDQELALTGLSWEQFRRELRHGPPGRQDELLAGLVAIARRDTEAVGVVAACLLPGLGARIARHAPGLAPDDAWSIAIGGLFEAIGQGELPASFVASRLLDVAKRHLQRAVSVEVPWAGLAYQLPDVSSPVRTDEPTARLLLTTAVSAGVLDRTDAWLLHSTLVVGHSLGWAARQLGISYAQKSDGNRGGSAESGHSQGPIGMWEQQRAAGGLAGRSPDERRPTSNPVLAAGRAGTPGAPRRLRRQD